MRFEARGTPRDRSVAAPGPRAQERQEARAVLRVDCPQAAAEGRLQEGVGQVAGSPRRLVPLMALVGERWDDNTGQEVHGRLFQCSLSGVIIGFVANSDSW